MAKQTIVTMPGDGIGNQVLPEALRLLTAVGFEAEYVHADMKVLSGQSRSGRAGTESCRRSGNGMSEA